MDHVDVIIVGAGLSGIGAAYQLQKSCPNKSYAILEGRETIGGTWDLFRYPGIRSDSDMHTLGYSFKPWLDEKSIADGPSILNYVNETAKENGIENKIRFNQMVRQASWSSDDAKWTLMIDEKGKKTSISCNFLYLCSGYYDYKEGYTPDFPGIDQYQGSVIHPQFWPDSLEYKNKHIVVIGSGATAMTLVPAMAAESASITMLQRSPTYVVSAPDKDIIANTLRKFLPTKLAYAITRFKNISMQGLVYKRSRTKPEKVKKMLLDRVRTELGAEYDVDTHFTPSYNPWDQRMCLVPNSDLFEAIRSGKASVVTDEISQFTETGIELKSGDKLDADIVITATGLNLKVLGGIEFTVDDKDIQIPDTLSYKGMMYSDIPNMVQTFGYINASWTLRADINSEYVCRLLNRMDELGLKQCTPRLRDEDKQMETLPWIDDFTPGYMQRKMHLFPRQGKNDPWRNTQNYTQDKKMIRKGALEDGVMAFT
ncbi:MAG: NAD(P)/FAD-dependent oxidoreductase [Pseudomonadales bacterium]|nr:NAD(P)/FAD-dependent oxidoreductase [Pseudomonadales bacterium]